MSTALLLFALSMPAEPEAALLSIDEDQFRIAAPIRLDGRADGASSLPVDRYGNLAPSSLALSPRARVGLSVETRSLFEPVLLWAEYEHDLVTGVAADPVTVEGTALYQAPLLHQLRKAYLRASLGNLLHLAAGVMTSDFGLGLLANDGSRRFTGASPRFSDPRGGDVVLRGLVATGPHTDLKLFAAFAVDVVQADDVLRPGDEALSVSGSLLLGRGQPTSAGAYLAHRRQSALDERSLDVTAIDLFAKTEIELPVSAKLRVAAEAALVIGGTDLAGSAEFPEQGVLQFGAVVQAEIDLGTFGAGLDFVYASGDQNADDDQQNAFRLDPSYELGLLLYRHTLSVQTSRSAVTAADPNLVGLPATGLERFETRGAISNTIAIFPRAFWRPLEGLVIYGGPLFAFSEVPIYDPLSTRVAGGSPRNALGGTPGSFLGTELDLGVRYVTELIERVELSAGIEGAVLFPGSAFDDPDDAAMDSVYGGRLLLGIRI